MADLEVLVEEYLHNEMWSRLRSLACSYMSSEGRTVAEDTIGAGMNALALSPVSRKMKMEGHHAIFSQSVRHLHPREAG